MADNTSIPIIVQGNSFSLAIPLQIYVIDDDSFVLQDYTPDPTDVITVQLKGSRRSYTYTPTIQDNDAFVALTGNELADAYGVIVSIVKANGQRLRSFRTDQFFIVESSDDLTTDDIIEGLEENVIYLNSTAFIAGADGRGIQSIAKTGTAGLVDAYTITYTDNTTSTFNVTNGAQGEAGASIASVEKTSTSGLVDTYTITLTNGNTSTFEVTNGMNGVDLGLANVVDDLTTGGSTNVLSAEMGKELGNLVVYEQRLDLNAYDIEQAYPNPTKWIADNSNYQYYGKFIPIPSGVVKIKIVGNAENSNQYCLLKNNSHVANSDVQYATGWTRTNLVANASVTIDNIPSDAQYLYTKVCLATNTATYGEPQSVTFVSMIPSLHCGDADGDFEVTDEIGNEVLKVEGGHIKTKYFDSSNINVDVPNFLIDKFAGKKIAIIGDSISTYSGWLPSDISGYSGTSYATYYPHGDVDDVSKTWWYKAMRYLGLNPSTDLNNCSWSGSRVSGDSTSTTSASAGCSTRRINDLALRITTPDIVLVFIGCNDWGNEVAVGSWAVTDAVPSEGTKSTFRPAFALMLNKIHVTYPNARVFVCTILDDYKRDEIAGYPPENGNGVVTTQWNDNIKEIAEAFGCDIINMHNCGLTYSNLQSFCVDEGLHPNAAGMDMMARKVASELMAKY